MSDLLAKKRERLEQLKKAAAEKKANRNKGVSQSTAGNRTQGGGPEDTNDLIDKVLTSSAFDERKIKEEEDDKPVIQKPINTDLTVALDQCEHSIAPAIVEHLEQEIQCERGKATLNAPDESSDGPETEKANKVGHEPVRRATLNKTNVNGIPMVSEIPGVALAKDQDTEDKESAKVKSEVKKIMAKEEADVVYESANFKDFFGKTSRLMERGLFSDIDVIGSFERLEVEEGDVATTKTQKITEKI